MLRSLRWRLVFLFVAAVSAVLGFAAVAVYRTTESQLINNRRVQTIEVVYWTLGTVEPSGQLSASSLEAVNRGLPWGFSPDMSFAVLDPAGRLTTSGMPPGGRAVSPELVGMGLPESGWRISGPQPGERHRRLLIEEPIRAPSGELIGYVRVSTVLDEAERALGRLRLAMAVIGLAGLVPTATLSILLTHFGLAPLRRMTGTVRAISAGDTGRRMTVDAGSELEELEVAFNELLNRLDTRLAEESANQDRMRQLLADVAHELRTPLTVLRGYTDLILQASDEGDPVAPRRTLEAMQAEVDRLTRLTRDLVTLGRIEAGIGIRRASVDMQGLCRRVVEQIGTVATDRTLIAEAPEKVEVEGDADRLAQLLLNLLDNAVVHTSPGGRIVVRVVTASGSCQVDVADDGEGIEAEDLPRIFDRFFKSTSRQPVAAKGLGLGLAIAKAIAEAHGGVISARSQPGKGTTFTFVLPLTPPMKEGSSRA